MAPRTDGSPTVELTPSLTADQIRAGSLRAVAVSGLAKVLVTLLRLATLVIVARLLAPEDFGVVMTILSVLGIATVLRDLGLTAATVRLADITASQINTIFWINAGLGALMTGLGCLAAPAIAGFFSDPRLETATLALSLNLVISGIGAQHLALLRRNLRFSELAWINLASATIGCGVSLGLALAGAAYWALVLAALATSAVTSIGAYVVSGWRPARPTFDRSVVPMIRFGGYVAAFGMMSYLGSNVHTILLGRYWGPAAVGLYVRALTFMNGPLGYVMEPLRTVVPANLSRLNAAPSGFREHYLSVTGVLMLGVAPFSGWLLVAADDLVAVLLGPQWAASASLLPWLALAAVPQVLSTTTGWLHLARGEARRLMRWGVAGWSVVIACLALGVQWGAPGVAVMYTVAMYLIVLPCMAYACVGTGVTVRDILGVTWRPVVGAAVATALVALASDALAPLPALARLLVTGAGIGAAYLLLGLFVLGQRAHLLEAWRQGLALLRKPRDR